jgi:NAD(P)-dependent dehydrogenase (short-subunit alcohol dehydrogenase family)
MAGTCDRHLCTSLNDFMLADQRARRGGHLHFEPRTSNLKPTGPILEPVLELKGRGAIVAGARRVGSTLVRRLAHEGVNIAIVYRRSHDEAEALAEEARKLTQTVVTLQADLTDEDDVARVVQEAKSGLGDLSYCINLAYDYPRVSVDKLSAADWERGMSGARGTFLMAAHASRVMSENQGDTKGHLIFFGDWAAEETPYKDYLPYLTGKAAVHFMTRAFAVELASKGILVNAILPGPTERPPDLS